jgi:hypothetical protein
MLAEALVALDAPGRLLLGSDPTSPRSITLLDDSLT